MANGVLLRHQAGDVPFPTVLTPLLPVEPPPAIDADDDDDDDDEVMLSSLLTCVKVKRRSNQPYCMMGKAEKQSES